MGSADGRHGTGGEHRPQPSWHTPLTHTPSGQSVSDPHGARTQTGVTASHWNRGGQVRSAAQGIGPHHPSARHCSPSSQSPALRQPGRQAVWPEQAHGRASHTSPAWHSASLVQSPGSSLHMPHP